MTNDVKQITKIGLFGHSHIISLLDALGNWRPPIAEGDDNFWMAGDYFNHGINLSVDHQETGKSYSVLGFPLANKTEGRWLAKPDVKNPKRVVLSRTFQAYLERFSECDVLISTVFGNEFAVLQFIEHLMPYDFAELGQPVNKTELRPNTRPIDRDDVRIKMEEPVRRIVLVLKTILHLYPKMKVAHLIPPPPIEDPSVAKSKEIFEDAFKHNKIVNSSLRLKWYNSYRYLLAVRLKEAGINMILPPESTVSSDGFLKPEFLEGLTHGNTEYGKLCWGAILQEVHA